MSESTSTSQMDIGLTDVAIIVPVYNSAPYLPDLFSSFENQTRKRFGVIFVDDGSTDESLRLLREWRDAACEFGIPCLVFHKDNGGQSSARNVGIEHLRRSGTSAPPLTLFVDSDDVLHPDAVNTLLKYEKDLGVDVLLYGSDVIYDSDQLEQRFPEYHTLYQRDTLSVGHIYNGADALAQLFGSGQFVAQPCLQVIRTSFLLESGIRFEEGVIHEDNLFSAQCLLRAATTSRIEQRLYIRRIRPGSTMTKPLAWKNAEGYFICAIRLLQLDGQSADSLELVSEISNTWLDQALHAYQLLTKSERQRYLELAPNDRSIFSITVLDRLRRNQLIEDAQTSRDALRTELDGIQGSVSFRVGNALTSAPRWLRNKLRSRQHC